MSQATRSDMDREKKKDLSDFSNYMCKFLKSCHLMKAVSIEMILGKGTRAW